jgi:hypothetical protein
MNVQLTFGALAAPLVEQLHSQGLAVLDCDAARLDHLQRDADALVRLVIRGVLTESAATVARRKLMKEVCKLKMTKRATSLAVQGGEG